MMEILHRKGMSLERLGAFLAVFEAGGIARAAPGDPVRQSQLSRQLGELERSLSCALFERRGRTLVPTPAAATLARAVRDLASDLAETAKTAEPARAATIGAGGSAIHWLVVPALARLTPPPRVETYVLSSEDVVEHLHDGRIDLGVLRADVLARDLASARIGVVRYRVFCARSAARHAQTAADLLAARPLVTVNGEPRLQPTLRTLGTPSLIVETFAQAALAIETGAFAGALPAFAERTLARPRFISLEHASLQRAAVPLVLAWRARLDDTRAHFSQTRVALLEGMRAALRAT